MEAWEMSFLTNCILNDDYAMLYESLWIGSWHVKIMKIVENAFCMPAYQWAAIEEILTFEEWMNKNNMGTWNADALVSKGHKDIFIGRKWSIEL